MKRFEEKDIKTQTVSDSGMTIELYVETGEKDVDQSIEYPLLKVYADEETEVQYLEFSSGNNLIQIPAAKVKAFLEAAEIKVNSESWYENNVFNQFKDI